MKFKDATYRKFAKKYSSSEQGRSSPAKPQKSLFQESELLKDGKKRNVREKRAEHNLAGIPKNDNSDDNKSSHPALEAPFRLSGMTGRLPRVLVPQIPDNPQYRKNARSQDNLDVQEIPEIPEAQEGPKIKTDTEIQTTDEQKTLSEPVAASNRANKASGKTPSLFESKKQHWKVWVAAALFLLLLIVLLFLLASLWRIGISGIAANGMSSTVENGISSDYMNSITQETLQRLREEEQKVKKDAYPEVNSLVNSYYAALASGDRDAYQETVDVYSESELETLEASAEPIEEYRNISCYTKPGLSEGACFVFTSYQLKFTGAATPAPGLTTLYVYADAEGNLKIFNGTADEALLEAAEAASSDPEIAALTEEVNAEYAEALEADKDLAALIGGYTEETGS